MNNTLITQDRLDSLVNLARQTPDGYNIAEVGVYKGGSLKFLAMNFPQKMCFGFDTFTGLPEEQNNEIEIHNPGDFSDTSCESVRKFLSQDVTNFELNEGLFPESVKDLGDLKIGFAHCDTDFYEGVKFCLEYFWPRLPSGGIIAFDDYKWSNCPGVEKALIEFGQPIHSGALYQAHLIKP